MRWYLTLIVVALPTVGNAAEGEAENLFREVEKNLQAAKTVQARFDAKFGTASLRGTLVLGEGDLIRMDSESTTGAKSFKDPALIGNGLKIVRVRNADSEKAQIAGTTDSPKQMGAALRKMLMQTGILLEFSDITKGKAKGAATFELSDFKLEAKEKIADVEARVIEYKVTIQGKNLTVWFGSVELIAPLRGMEKVTAKMWIDTKNNLPIKQQIQCNVDESAVDFVQTFTINGKLNVKQFEIQK